MNNYIIFLREYNETFYFVSKKKLSGNTIKYKSKSFIVNLSQPNYIIQSKAFFFFDFDTGSQIGFNKVNPNLTPEELDLMVGQKIVKEITSGITNNIKDKIWNFVIGFIIGGLLIGLIAVMYYSNQIQEILNTPILPF